MDKVSYYIKKYYIFILTGIIILLNCTIIFLIIVDNEKIISKNENIEKMELSNKVKEEKLNKIKVEIKGAVNKPGVYEMDDDSRVVDVINIAEGTRDDANLELINLSKKLTDEMVIIIYTNDEIYNYNVSKIKTEYVYIEVESCPDAVNDACIKEHEEENKENLEIGAKLININTATIEQLTTLTGVGESKAKAIIEYRNKNKFNAIEDIKNISGIGDSLFEKIKNDITV